MGRKEWDVPSFRGETCGKTVHDVMAEMAETTKNRERKMMGFEKERERSGSFKVKGRV